MSLLTQELMVPNLLNYLLLVKFNWHERWRFPRRGARREKLRSPLRSKGGTKLPLFSLTFLLFLFLLLLFLLLLFPFTNDFMEGVMLGL